MYRDEDQFVLGQKIKLGLIAIVAFIVWAANGFHFKGMLK